MKERDHTITIEGKDIELTAYEVGLVRFYFLRINTLKASKSFPGSLRIVGMKINAN